MQLIIGPEAITSYKRLDYTPWHALAEFVDNSTQSYFDHQAVLHQQMEADGEVLTVRIVYDKSNGYLRVTDNAMGMCHEELVRALHVARRPKNTNGRSKYGMGMKTAACWIGNRWSITTKKLGEASEHSVQIDVDQVATGDSQGVTYSCITKPSKLHYTMIEIRDLNRQFHGRTLGKIKDFLRSMYRVDLQAGEMELYWRDQKLSWESLDSRILVSNDGTKYKKDFTFTVDERPITGWVGVLDKGSRAAAGFSILQANRVVKGWPDAWRPTTLYGQIHGSNDLVNQRLVGEIHLDGFDVSHTKDNILWRDSQEEDVEDELKKYCGDYRDFAKKRRKRKDDERGPSEVDVKAALEELEEELKSPEMVDQINIVAVPPADAIEAGHKKTIESVTSARRPTLEGMIDSRPSIVWKIFLADLSPYDHYVVSESTTRGIVTVIVNRNHPYWDTQLEGVASVRDYLRQCVYDAVAESQARERVSTIDPNTVKQLKDALLRVPFQMESHEE